MMEPTGDMEVSLPDLVFELVSKHLYCPKILRPCRLVCKSWNNIACEILQKCPVAFRLSRFGEPQKYNLLRLRDFLDLLASRKEEISHPFRRISIKEISLEERYWDLILQLQQYEDIEVSNLEFAHWPDDRKALNIKREIMTWSQDTLRSLSLRIEGPFFCDQFEWKVENLEKLEIYYREDFFRGNERMKGPIKALLESILRWPKLSKLSVKLKVGDFETLKDRILSIEKMRHVFSLEICNLNFDDKNREKHFEILRHFAENPFPNVKKLKSSGKFEFTLPLVEIFAHSLEVISYTEYDRESNSPIDLDLFPTCPQLRELNLVQTDMCAKGDTFVAKFPSLKRFSCRLGLKILGDVRPHFGVEYLYFGVKPKYRGFEHNSEICTCCKVGRDIQHHFSHLSHNICQAKEDLCAGVECLWSMVNYFPNVRALKIQDCGELIDFVSSEIGTTLFKDDVTDVRFESIFRNLFPLESFCKLNSLDLTFYSDITLTPAVIRLGLGRIPSLKYFRFQSMRRSEINNETVKAFRECLEPSTELQILNKFCSYSHRNRNPEEKEALNAKIFPLVINWICDCFCGCALDSKVCKCPHCKNLFPFD